MSFSKQREYAAVPPPPTIIPSPVPHEGIPVVRETVAHTGDRRIDVQTRAPRKKDWKLMHCERCLVSICSLYSYAAVGRRCRKCGGTIAKGPSPLDTPRKRQRTAPQDQNLPPTPPPPFHPSTKIYDTGPFPF